MADLYRRTWRLVAGTDGEQALEVTGLRVTFKIERSHKPEPNGASVGITNLGQASRSKLSAALEKGLKVTVEAGYAGAMPMLFRGRIARVWHRRDGPDWSTSLEADDGAGELAAARVSKSFTAGTSVAAAFRAMASELGVGLGNAATAFKEGNFTRGMETFVESFVAHGTGKEVLDRITAAAGLEYSVQDNQLVITRPGEPGPGQAVVLAPSTGLIGAPEPGDKGIVRCRALLRPGLDPPRKVQLESESTSGLYRVERVVYSGDSRGPDWYAALDLTRATA